MKVRDAGAAFKTPRRGNPLRPVVAVRALRALARSGGTDLQQGVIFLRATEGNAAARAFDRFRNSPNGQCVLEQRRVLRERLQDVAALSRLPARSLGQAYAAFMLREQLSMPGLLDLAMGSRQAAVSDDELVFAERSHVMHDLWHVVTGYGSEELGEVCILAVRSAQLRHLGVWFLCLAGMLAVGRRLGLRQVCAAVCEAYRRGRVAAWLYAVDWEGLLPEPLDVVRQKLNLADAVNYPLPAGSGISP